jgi:hypothetical protein
MPFSFAVSACLDHAAQPVHAPAPRFYSTDLLPTMQGFLAAVADIETRYEIEREQIEQGSGPEEVKQHLRSELERQHQQARTMQVQRLARLQEQIRTARSFY